MDSHGLLDSTNLIVLSDHGLLKVDEEEQFYLEECLSDFSRVKRVANSLAMMQVFPAEGEEDTVIVLSSCNENLGLFRVENLRSMGSTRGLRRRRQSVGPSLQNS